MAFSELNKNLDSLREYMRDFYIYGYKVRADYDRKSSRTYDNERRRIESYLGEYIGWRYGKNGKHFFVSLDAGQLPANPFYKIYQSKSFTDNDITLHFLLLDILTDGRQLTVSQITEELMNSYAVCFDQQTVRNKLREYAESGIFRAEKNGRTVLYSRSPLTLEGLLPQDAAAADFLAFFSEAVPFAVVGSYLVARLNAADSQLLFKHRFLFHTLDDGILLTIMQALAQNRLLTIDNFSVKTQRSSEMTGLPLKILVSTQNGRRYLAFYDESNHRLYNLRLDYIRSARLAEICPEANALREQMLPHFAACWGVSLPQRNRLEHLSFTITADEKYESYIINRLEREKRQGVVSRLAPNMYRFDIDTNDSGELLSWIKTFIGRIVAFEGDNPVVVNRFYDDLRRLYDLYEVKD